MFVFLCDLMSEGGLGHLRRTEAIALELRELKRDCAFVFLVDETSSKPSALKSFEFQYSSCRKEKLNSTIEKWKDESDFLIVDSYSLKAEDLTQLSSQFRIGLICDEAPAYLTETLDLIVFPHFTNDENSKAFKKLSLQVFCGTQFFPFRKSLKKLGFRAKSEIKRIHLQLGGSSTESDYQSILETLRPQLQTEKLYVIAPDSLENFSSFKTKVQESGADVQVLQYSEMKPEDWTLADLLIGPSSVTAYEYALLGTPILYRQMAAHQNVVSQTIEQLGLGAAYSKQSLIEAREKLSAWSSHCIERFSQSRLSELVQALHQA